MAKRPNILLMISHDLGNHIGPYGHALDRSPNLMALARESTRLDAHFVSSPGCSQSRSSLVTGRYPHANGQFGLATWGWRLHDDEILMPALLRSHGYHTRLFGIWHLHEWTLGGFSKVSEDVSTRDASPEGFAEIAGSRAADWIRDRGREEEPFYLHVGFWEVHRPFCGTAEEAEEAARSVGDEGPVPSYLPDNEPTRREIAELHHSVGRVDQAVGSILESLQETGLAENTLVLFTADHGLPFPRAKGTLYDPGIKVACMARWPERIPAGVARSELSSNVDLMPTLLETAGIECPRRVQGRSLWPLLQGGRVRPDGTIFAEKTYHEHYDPMRCLRTARYKYIRNFEDRPKLVLPTDLYLSPTRVSMADDEGIWGRRAREELYDLMADPEERNNLIEDEGLADEAGALRQDLQRWMEATGDPILQGPILRGPEQVKGLGGSKITQS